MTATTDVTIWCDETPTEAPMACGEYIQGESAALARYEAKRYGWKVNVRTPGDRPRDYCPAHAKALATKKKKKPTAIPTTDGTVFTARVNVGHRSEIRRVVVRSGRYIDAFTGSYYNEDQIDPGTITDTPKDLP